MGTSHIPRFIVVDTCSRPVHLSVLLLLFFLFVAAAADIIFRCSTTGDDVRGVVTAQMTGVRIRKAGQHVCQLV